MRKLNIGCGPTHLEGYDNLDITPFWTPEPDIIADARNMYMIRDETYDLVRSYGFLEHIEPVYIPNVLSEMFRVLKWGGECHIGADDFEFQVNEYLKNGISGWTIDSIFGPRYSHRSVVDEAYVRQEMKKVGFKHIERFDYEFINRQRYNYSTGMLYMIGKKEL